MQTDNNNKGHNIQRKKKPFTIIINHKARESHFH